MFDLLFPSRLPIVLLPNIMYYFLFLTMMKQKGLNQMRRLSYDIEYQNGHAMSLKSLNKMPR